MCFCVVLAKPRKDKTQNPDPPPQFFFGSRNFFENRFSQNEKKTCPECFYTSPGLGNMFPHDLAMASRSSKPHARRRGEVWRRVGGGGGVKIYRSWKFFGVEKSSKIDFPKIVLERPQSVFMRPTTSDTCFRTISRWLLCVSLVSLMHAVEWSAEAKEGRSWPV